VGIVCRRVIAWDGHPVELIRMDGRDGPSRAAAAPNLLESGPGLPGGTRAGLGVVPCPALRHACVPYFAPGFGLLLQAESRVEHTAVGRARRAGLAEDARLYGRGMIGAARAVPPQAWWKDVHRGY
jgi:hypothetical protein